MTQTTHTMTRTLPQHLSDIGISFEDLRQDVCTVFGKTPTEASGVILQAWLNNELDALIYESGICD